MWGRLAIGLATLAAALVVTGGQPTASASSCPPSAPPSPVAEALPVVAAASPVAQETAIHWTRAHRRLTYGDQAVLEGQVVTSDGAVGDATVDLYQRTAAADEWTYVASATTDPDSGLFGFGCLEPARTTTYRVVHEATVTLAYSQGERRVGVSRRMPDHLEQVGPNRFVFSGAVAPRYAGPVTLERRTCAGCTWRDAASRRTGARSTWRFELDLTGLERDVVYRATIPADRRFARSVSDRVWRFTVR